METWDLIREFFKAKKAKDFADQLDIMPEDTMPSGTVQAPPQSYVPTPDVLGTGMANDAAAKALERKRRLQQIERDLFY